MHKSESAIYHRSPERNSISPSDLWICRKCGTWKTFDTFFSLTRPWGSPWVILDILSIVVCLFSNYSPISRFLRFGAVKHENLLDREKNWIKGTFHTNLSKGLDEFSKSCNFRAAEHPNCSSQSFVETFVNLGTIQLKIISNWDRDLHPQISDQG